MDKFPHTNGEADIKMDVSTHVETVVLMSEVKEQHAKKCRKQGISGNLGLSENRFGFPNFFVLRVRGNWSTVKND